MKIEKSYKTVETVAYICDNCGYESFSLDDIFVCDDCDQEICTICNADHTKLHNNSP